MTLIHQPDMSLEIADRLLAGVRRLAEQEGVRLAAVVLDRGGNLVAAARMDAAQLGATSLAADKAYTAAAFGQPTSAWAESSAPGGSDWGLGSTLGGRAVVFPGGVPIYADGTLIGALGVSGAASVTDAQCADSAVTEAGFATAR
jgi:uncharacterized protein GlcG (DUF336 family)